MAADSAPFRFNFDVGAVDDGGDGDGGGDADPSVPAGEQPGEVGDAHASPVTSSPLRSSPSSPASPSGHRHHEEQALGQGGGEREALEVRFTREAVEGEPSRGSFGEIQLTRGIALWKVEHRAGDERTASLNYIDGKSDLIPGKYEGERFERISHRMQTA